MIAKIIIGFLAIIGALDILVAIETKVFPKSKVTKFICKYCGIPYNKDYEVID
ncbi:MAG: hypothetical protein ACLR4A_02695 [Christensenellales bacterium]